MCLTQSIYPLTEAGEMRIVKQILWLTSYKEALVADAEANLRKNTLDFN